MNKPATVFILTYCRHMEFFYGTELVFKTLRVGFPNARITVVDNASIPEAASEVAALAKQNDCAFEHLGGRGVAHHEFIEDRLMAAASDSSVEGPLVFIDPDICFWECCEDFCFGGLLAGRLVRAFYCAALQTLMMPRIHTSFMWIPDARRLWGEIEKIRSEHFDFQPFLSCSMKIAGQWCRFDTGGSLYAAIPDKVSCFTEEHLNRYDHIYSGSHLDWLYPVMHPQVRELFSRIHASARDGDLAALRGIWKLQEQVFRVRPSGQAISMDEGGLWRKRKAHVR